MKFVFAIVLCSLLSAIAGYYYGKSTLPRLRPVALPEAPVSSEVVVSDVVNDDVPTPEPAEPVVEEEPEELLSIYRRRAAEELNTLTNAKGQAIQAVVLAVTEDQVTIRRSDGLETSFPLGILSEEDIAFCEYLRLHPTPAMKSEAAPDHGIPEGLDLEAIFGD